jgi:hypothetical protein
MCHFLDRAGQLSTIWERPKVETIEAAEPLVKSAVAKARRIGGTSLRIEVYDDLLCKLAFRGRPK